MNADVESINRGQGLAILDDGRIAYILNMFDNNGEETQTSEDAVVGVFITDPHSVYYVVPFCNFEEVAIH